MVPVADSQLCTALAGDLRAAGFTAEAVREAWGDAADDAIARGLRSPADRALGERRDALATLARLFVLGMPQPAASVDLALPATGSAGVVALGLARLDGDVVVPAAVVRPQSYTDEIGPDETGPDVTGLDVTGPDETGPDVTGPDETGLDETGPRVTGLDVTGPDEMGGRETGPRETGPAQWWIASDLDEAALGGPLPEDHVLGVGGASLTLAALQLPTPARRGLDVGAGCGIQALRARRAVAEVVATDISERALAYTRFNALLNGVDGIETRCGSLFEPVDGELFDRIVSNPPFVITPRVEGVPAYEYRDGGLAGDDLVAAFVGGVGAQLEPGGVAQLLGNWETRAGTAGLDRVREWVECSPVPLDAWVVERESLDPLSYAELWVRDGGTLPGTPGFARLVDAWLDDFTSREVSEVGFGYILLRRPAAGAPTLARYERVATTGTGGDLGSHLAEALATHDRLTVLDDAGLAASTLVVASDVTEARHHVPGSEDPSVIELRQGGGFGRVLSVDPAFAAFVGACDGDLSAGALIDAIAQIMEVDAAQLRAETFPRIREAAFTGLLEIT